MSDSTWHVLPAPEVLRRMDASRGGLAEKEAARRLAEHGPNEIQETKSPGPATLLAGQFRSFIVWLLLGAAVVAAALGEWLDAASILAIVVLNALIGFYQEFKAERSIAALRKLTAPRARVRREGRTVVVPEAQVVPGDILVVGAGDLVAADARLLEAHLLRCLESSLTGESEPVDKNTAVLSDPHLPQGDRANMLFKGTSVALGEGQAVVVATGMRTELGRIAGMVAQGGAEERTPLQRKLDASGRMLAGVSLGIVALVFVLGLARHIGFVEMFSTSVGLAVAAVPEGLPAIVTLALALGVQRMSRRRALVRRLLSVETLGSASVICTDKTGTLTVGEMTVRELFVAGRSFTVTGEGYGPHGEVLFEGRATGSEHAEPLLELATALLASNNAELILEDGNWRVVGEPTEGAMLVAGSKAGGRRHEIEEALPRRHEIPFDSGRKRRTVVRRLPEGHLRAFVNGAPDVLLQRCTKMYAEDGPRPLTEEDRRLITRQNEAMAERSLRVLGAAYRDLPHGTQVGDITEEVEDELIFVGLAGMHDPPRPEAAEAVARCHEAGIRVVMITGDHPRTALAIARNLGIAMPEDSAVSGAELNQLSDGDLGQRALHVAVYARVTAEDKQRIVQAWKASGAVVAMTGDGVNDAPALKAADIGVAMGIRGTEAAKQAADIIIADDNFASIVAAVEQGRGIYDNIRKALQYLLAGNVAELLVMMVCIVAGFPAPLLPIHLLWINLLTDGLPALCLATDAIDPDVMKRRPRPEKDGLFDRRFLLRLLFSGGVTAAVCFSVFVEALKEGGAVYARSMAFTALVCCELLKSLSFRHETKLVCQLPLKGSLQLPLVIVASLGLQLLLHVQPLNQVFKTVPPSWSRGWLLLAMALVPFAALEIAKLVRQRR